MRQHLVMQDGKTHSVTKDLPPIEYFQCGECCIRYRLRLLDEEINHMARELSISGDDFVSRYVHIMPDQGSFILDNGEKQCPFLSWDQEFSKARCMIYQSRPQACRNWVASLSRHECQEGLKKLRGDESILLPENLYLSGNKIRHSVL